MSATIATPVGSKAKLQAVLGSPTESSLEASEPNSSGESGIEEESSVPAPDHCNCLLGSGGQMQVFSKMDSEVATVEAVLRDHDTFIFDVDGTVWHDNILYEGSAATLGLLTKLGKRCFFISNSHAYDRAQMLAKFTKNVPGESFTVENMVTGASALASYISTNSPNVKKCFLIGTSAVKRELEAVGITCIGGGVDSGGHGEAQCAGDAMTQSKFDNMNVDDNCVQAVVVAGDFAFTYVQICIAVRYLQSDPNMPVFAGSNDQLSLGDCEGIRDTRMPGPTRIVTDALRVSAGVKAIVTGKPSLSLAQNLMQRYGFKAERTCMAGDRLDTDILMGNLAGFSSLLVFSGVTSKSALPARLAKDPRLTPKYQLASIGRLASIATQSIPQQFQLGSNLAPSNGRTLIIGRFVPTKTTLQAVLECPTKCSSQASTLTLSSSSENGSEEESNV